MTPDEWVLTINKLIAKTRDGRVVWQDRKDKTGRQARVGEHVAVFTYKVKPGGPGKREPVPGSLALALATATGQVYERLTESEAKATPHPADEVALRSLFDAVVDEPVSRQADDFMKALDDL
ncbi:MAG TPA: hypothetical protein DCZ72_09860 [Armatimonadetes bacterium]|nr:hypothetical protein [Armatimonadota bacterium]